MNKAKILIVENNKDMCFLYQEALKSAGYKAESICDAEKAISYIHENRPDLVLLDI